MRNYVEIINTVDKLPVRTKEGVHFGFGFNVPDGVVRMDVPWGVVRPEVDQIPGACKNWFTVQRWVDVSNDQRGITWLTPDAPLVEVGGITANLIGSLSDPAAWLDRLEPSQTDLLVGHEQPLAHQLPGRAGRPDGVPLPALAARAATIRQRRRVALECSQPLVVAAARGELPQDPRLRLSQPRRAGDGVEAQRRRPGLDRAAVRGSRAGRRNGAEVERPAPTAVWLSDASEKPLKPVTGPIQVPA